MSKILKQVQAWPFTFGGEAHHGWLPAGAATPLPTPSERELLDVHIERVDGGYLLVWAARPSPTSPQPRPPKIGDSWHDTLEDAENAARDDFGITPKDWTDVNESS